MALLPASSYDADLADTITRGLALLGPDVRGRRVLLKPNMVEYEAGSAINTHPRVVAAAATALLETIAAQPWTGLFLTCDYGRSLHELLTEYPAGTARAYHRHRQSNDLLAQPGEQDLTRHLCWDWHLLIRVLFDQSIIGLINFSVAGNICVYCF
mgnify:CR=1 FL=1